MELKERIALMIKENRFKQKEFASTIGVTEGYVSTLLSGRSQNISNTAAYLIEERLGYSSQWVLTGQEPKYKQISKNPNISDIHKKVIFLIEKMPDERVMAVLAFIESLEKVKSALNEKAE